MKYPPFVRRTLAIAILVSFVSVCAFTVLTLSSTYSGNQDMIIARRENLGRLRAVVAQAGLIDQFAAELARSEFQGPFLATADPALTAAEMQAEIATWAAESSAILTSSRAIEPELAGGFLAIAVELDIQGNLASIESTLARVEAAVPVLFIDEAHFRGQGGGVGDGSEIMVNAHLRVRAMMRSEGIGVPREPPPHALSSPAL